MRNLVKTGALPIGTKVVFTWNGELITGKVRMSYRYWNGSLLVEVPEGISTGYSKFCGRPVVDIRRTSVRILAGK